MSLSNSDDNLFNISEDLAPPPIYKAAAISSVDFDGLLQPPLQLAEDLKEGCGGQLWPAGMVLAKYLLRQPKDMFSDKTIVELGAGGGLVGLALASHVNLQQPLYITDQLPMFELMKRNITLNHLDSRVYAEIYDWGEPTPSTLPSHPDVVLAADCVYFEPAFPLLQKTLEDLIGKNTVCLFCFKKRRRADLTFVKAIRKVFEVVDVEDDPDRNVWSREGLFLYKISRRRNALVSNAKEN